MESVRIGLVDRALAFDGSESLPISVSIGRATFPDHALSVTDLLSSAVGALQEAKASGGDAIRLAGAVPDVPAASQTFNLFEGLILAVDAKDRYTKRHCEDVSRYAVYLARRLGLDEETVAVDPGGRAPARRRQDRHPRRDPAQAGEPHGLGDGCRPAACRARRHDGTYRRVLPTSFGFGGLNAALVFGSVLAGDPGIARREA